MDSELEFDRSDETRTMSNQSHTATVPLNSVNINTITSTVMCKLMVPQNSVQHPTKKRDTSVAAPILLHRRSAFNDLPIDPTSPDIEAALRASKRAKKF